MKVEELKIDRDKARELWQKYQSHRAHQTPADADIAAIYKRLARGQTVIRALASIVAAGVNAEGLPRLAIARADTQRCYLHHSTNEARFSDQRWGAWNGGRLALKSRRIAVPWPDMPRAKGGGTWEATVPLIPVHLRPKRGLANYHILWEAEWTKRYPVDPYLLRRFGGDAWLVVAAWDLTEVERAVMSSRLSH